MKNYPSISIIIPTFNEEKNLPRCLKAIFSQNYPKDKLEVWIVDNYSTDKTVQIAQKYPIKLLFNKIKDAQLSKMLAFKKLKTEFFCYLDADIEIIGRNWLKKMIFPLLDDPEIVGSFTGYYVKKNDYSLNRFLSYELLQRDPLFEFLSPSVEKTIVEKRNSYFLCQYQPNLIPPSGLCLYRRKFLLKTIIPKREKLMELDNLAILVGAGFNKFAYVPQAGIYHLHIKSLRQLIQKRIRNLKRNFLPQPEERYYTWIDFNNPKEILRLGFWIIYANLFLPALVKGVYKSIKFRDFACLWEPVVSLIVTDLTLFAFLFSSGGRGVIKKVLKAFYHG